MKYSIFLALLVFVLSCVPVSYHAQTKENGFRTSTGCKVPTPQTLKRLGKLTEEQEAKYRSPIRYVIVYNEIGPTEDRRIDLFMNVKNINEKDLKLVFCWVAEQNPSPVALTINVHTNLATIETPDERELISESNGGRLSKYSYAYKEADYHRFEDGREAFGYVANLSPYTRRQVLIKEGADRR